MGPFDVMVFAWLLLVMGAAVVESVREFRATPGLSRAARRRAAGIACLAFFYCLGYAAVLLELVSVATWSQFFRGVSLLAIPLVWIDPARSRRLRWENDREAAARLVRTAEQMREGAHRRA